VGGGILSREKEHLQNPPTPCQESAGRSVLNKRGGPLKHNREEKKKGRKGDEHSPKTHRGKQNAGGVVGGGRWVGFENMRKTPIQEREQMLSGVDVKKNLNWGRKRIQPHWHDNQQRVR